MFDTHCHLNFPSLLEKSDEIVKNSKKAGVKGIIVASSTLKDSKVSIDLAKKYPGYLYASVGIHPQENCVSVRSQLVELDQLAQSGSVVAIGETGLDFSEGTHHSVHPKIQEELFLGQIKLAQKYNLPLIIHARESNDEIITLLKASPLPLRSAHATKGLSRGTPCEASLRSPLRGVFHCYSGGKKRISKILDLPGVWYFGFDGNLTYDIGLQEVIKLIPVERIVIETDSPYLSPLPYRSQENTPANLPLIQQKINEIFGRDLTGQILRNSCSLFQICPI